MRQPVMLVVDDEESFVASLTCVLSKEGFSLQSAYDGEQALTEAAPISPDLVLLDVMLPGMSGMEVCRRLKKKSGPVVIMLTAKSDDVDTVIGLDAGADDYVAKPFSRRVLLARIRAALRKQLMVCEQIEAGRLVLDPGSFTAVLDGKHLDLTPRLFPHC